MKILSDIQYNRYDRCMLDMYLPDEKDCPVLLFFHGGGLESGSRKDYALFGEIFTKQGIAFVSADYRMYPDCEYPDFLCDGAAAADYVIRTLNPAGLFIGGSSAGAYISMMLCLDKKYLGKYGIDSDALPGYILNAGPPAAHPNVLNHRGLDKRRVIVDDSSALYHIDRSTIAPTLVLVSDNDMFGRLEQNAVMVKTLEHFGNKNCEFHIIKGYGHCEYDNIIQADGGTILTDAATDFIKRRFIR